MREILTADDNCNYFYYEEIKGGTDKHRDHSDRAVFESGGFAAVMPKAPSGSLTINPYAKQRKRDWLAQTTLKSLRRGGYVKQCPPGPQVKFRFGTSKPPSGSAGTSRGNDLSRRRWSGPLLDKREERELIRQAKSDNDIHAKKKSPAKQRLVECFHRFILVIVSEYSGPPHNELMAAGVAGFCEAVNRFNENRSYRLATYASHWIRKYVRLAVKDWRREGAAGETRQDRYLFSNPNATAEEIVAAVGGTLTQAEGAIARLDGVGEQYDTTEGSYDDDDNPKLRVAASHEMHRLFDAFSHGQPSLKQKAILGSSRPSWIDDLADYHIKEAQRTLNRIGRRQYALELVERDKVRIAYRAKPERYLYGPQSVLKDYASFVDEKSARIRALEDRKKATLQPQQEEIDVCLKPIHAPLPLLSPPPWLTQQKRQLQEISHHFHSFADAPLSAI